MDMQLSCMLCMFNTLNYMLFMDPPHSNIIHLMASSLVMCEAVQSWVPAMNHPSLQCCVSLYLVSAIHVHVYETPYETPYEIPYEIPYERSVVVVTVWPVVWCVGSRYLHVCGCVGVTVWQGWIPLLGREGRGREEPDNMELCYLRELMELHVSSPSEHASSMLR